MENIYHLRAWMDTWTKIKEQTKGHRVHWTSTPIGKKTDMPLKHSDSSYNPWKIRNMLKFIIDIDWSENFIRKTRWNPENNHIYCFIRIKLPADTAIIIIFEKQKYKKEEYHRTINCRNGNAVAFIVGYSGTWHICNCEPISKQLNVEMKTNT